MIELQDQPLKKKTKTNPPLAIQNWGFFPQSNCFFFFFFFTIRQKRKMMEGHFDCQSLSSMRSDKSFNESQPIESRSKLICCRRRRRSSRRCSTFLISSDFFLKYPRIIDLQFCFEN